jgi:hypothetical protein
LIKHVCPKFRNPKFGNTGTGQTLVRVFTNFVLRVPRCFVRVCLVFFRINTRPTLNHEHEHYVGRH